MSIKKYHPLTFKYTLYKPNFADNSNIFNIGFLAAFIRPSSIKISGCPYFNAIYIFSIVFNFICGQSLQAQLLLGGAGIKVLSGLDFCIWCKIPVSVATMNSM